MRREVNFDGLVGPTHNYAGLSPGNLASIQHGGLTSNPKAAALEGLQKMQAVAALGVGQAVLPPQPRPALGALRSFGFGGTDAQVLQAAFQQAPQLLARCCSASAMWTANAATVIPSCDSVDGRLHLVPANLASLFHRQLETATTTRVLRAIFTDTRHFQVHDPVPTSAHYGDEGAANHTRLVTSAGAVHLFAWGRSTRLSGALPSVHPPRQCLEASQAVARMTQLDPKLAVFPKQAPSGIDAGAFHTDVLAVGNGCFLMLHEQAFEEKTELLDTLKRRLGNEFVWCLAKNNELPVQDAIAAYPFNSQIVGLPTQLDPDAPETSDAKSAPCPSAQRMAIIAPKECEETATTRAFLERVVAEENPVEAVHYHDVRQSMSNGGGPACLRLRVSMNQREVAALGANVLLSDSLFQALRDWVNTHYRDRLSPKDLADPELLDESRQALDELTQLLGLGSVYDFQA